MIRTKPFLLLLASLVAATPSCGGGPSSNSTADAHAGEPPGDGSGADDASTGTGTGGHGSGTGGAPETGADGEDGVGGSAGSARDGREGTGGASAPLVSDAADSTAPDQPDTAADSQVADCPAGWALCTTECVDTSISRFHCGGCNQPCTPDERCIAGACIGPQANDGCTSDLAQGITLAQVAVYQSVKIPVMRDAIEVAATSRNASIVEGRDTLVRAFVNVSKAWTARELAARLTLTAEDGTPVVFSAKQTISAASTDDSLASTFQVFLPASMMTAGLRYSLAIVECSKRSGTAGNARFPETGELDLGVVSVGDLKVKLIPIQVGDLVPDTSDGALAAYTAELKALYPIRDVAFTIGDTLTTSSPVDWEGMLKEVRSKRASDKPDPDVYYFGLVKPDKVLRVYCLTSCTMGIGYVVPSADSYAAVGRVAVGVGYGDRDSAETMAHELGHNQGREHAPCTDGGSIANPDPDYPYPKAAVGVWGYDCRTRTLIDPNIATDLMSYCGNRWISDYTYAGIAQRVRQINGVAARVHSATAAPSRWWIMDIDSQGANWGMVLDEAGAAGEAEQAIVYDSRGQALTAVTVYRTAVSNRFASMVMVPEPKPGWDTIAVDGAHPLSFGVPRRSPEH